MNLSRCTRLMLTCSLLLGLAACGGGGGAPVSGVGIGGTGKPGVTFGAIDDLAGGVTVAGTRFDAAAATVTLGEASGSTGDLRAGHVVTVQGTTLSGTGVADSIAVDEVIKGRLEAKPGAALLTVQGQAVEIDSSTVFGTGISPASADGLLVDDLLEVWGFVKAPGVVRATRIERESSLSERRVIGFAENVDTVNKRFDIGGQTMAYGAADVSDLPGGDPQPGQLVRVRGALGIGGVIDATRVDAFDLPGDDDDDAEIEGFVASILSATRFTLAGVTVETSAQTVYVGGGALDVLVGALLEVEGTLAGGVVRADRIEFDAGVELEGDVEQKVGSMLSLVGFPGLVVLVDGQTEFDGDASSLADVVAGDHVRIEARIVGGSTVVAVELKEESADTRVRFQGPVDALPAPADPLFQMLGMTIDTSTIPVGAFQSPTGAIISRATFFAGLTPGRVVQLQGDLVAGTAVWDQAELDDD